MRRGITALGEEFTNAVLKQLQEDEGDDTRHVG